MPSAVLMREHAFGHLEARVGSRDCVFVGAVDSQITVF